MRRVFKFLGYVLVTIYFVADFMFEAVALPLSAWIGRLQILRPVNAWIAGLRPYPALALFSIPVVLLEPVKPIGAFLVSAGHVVEGILTIAVGEILKITLVERLFGLTTATACCRSHSSQLCSIIGDWVSSMDLHVIRNLVLDARSEKERLKLSFKRGMARIKTGWADRCCEVQMRVAPQSVAIEGSAQSDAVAHCKRFVRW